MDAKRYVSTPSTVMHGLVPRIHDLQSPSMKAGYVYIMNNRPNGTLA
jgi:hypothetical protein